jgi:glyoxylase-like metal-dependent hydrolase (beta-lactamase superfamily II)
MKVLLLSCVLAMSAFATGALLAAEPFSEPSQLDQRQAGYHRLKIGKTNVIAVSDGAATFDVLGIIPKEKKADTERVLAKSLVKSPIMASVNAFVIFAGEKTIMVDAGTGSLFGVKLGKLPDSLRAAGIQPDSITDILVTHIHPDHTGGLTVGGKMAFPNATLHVNKKELDFWTNESAGDNASGPTKQFFGQVESTVGPYVTAGSVKTFDGDTEVLPGIRSQPAYGHTPGHTFYVLEDGGQALVFMGDTIHAPDAQFEDPSITVAFDVDQRAAAATREKAFADAADAGYFVAFDHMYFPGVGRIKKESVGYRWLPIPYVSVSPRP